MVYLSPRHKRAIRIRFALQRAAAWNCLTDRHLFKIFPSHQHMPDGWAPVRHPAAGSGRSLCWTRKQIKYIASPQIGPAALWCKIGLRWFGIWGEKEQKSSRSRISAYQKYPALWYHNLVSVLMVVFLARMSVITTHSHCVEQITCIQKRWTHTHIHD